MPSQRDRSKKLVGFFATEDEWKAIHQAAKAANLTVADWLRQRIAEAKAKQKPTTRREAKGN